MDLAMFCLVNSEEFESVNAQIEACRVLFSPNAVYREAENLPKAAHSEEGRRRLMTLDHFIV
jgi:hypothetical protein